MSGARVLCRRPNPASGLPANGQLPVLVPPKQRHHTVGFIVGVTIGSFFAGAMVLALLCESVRYHPVALCHSCLMDARSGGLRCAVCISKHLLLAWPSESSWQSCAVCVALQSVLGTQLIDFPWVLHSAAAAVPAAAQKGKGGRRKVPSDVLR